MWYNIVMKFYHLLSERSKIDGVAKWPNVFGGKNYDH